ncbi:MAG: hypothetical protein FWH53_04420 [Leptospirales bacterium]|nr:hypothetical protein [Leptospirales bacterium]
MNKTKYIIITLIVIITIIALSAYILPLTTNYNFTKNYRIPHSKNEDYYLYKMYSKHIASDDYIQVIGDSVIWGHYVSEDDTLPAYLNRFSKDKKFANMGLEGSYPIVMNGLIENFSADLKNKKIIVGFNLLWISSSKHDLSGEPEMNINHKKLLPQIYPKLPSYNPNIEDRLSAIISLSAPFILIEHIKMNCFKEKNFYAWTMDNPHDSITDYFAGSSADIYIPPAAMKIDKTNRQNIDWVDIEKSIQWKFMLKTIDYLKKNGNDIIVLITPFNTYMLNDTSREKYYSIISDIAERLSNAEINFIIPVVHEKDFADSSHFTAEGYRAIAEGLLDSDEFRRFMEL